MMDAQESVGYNSSFYNHYKSLSEKSAVLILSTLFKYIQPKSIVDVGCGIGTWLAAAQHLGVDDIQGLDGNWVRPNDLLIPTQKFTSADLNNPLRLNRTFDLVISMEVAEHLPEVSAETFIDTLVNLGSCILFSAAIPQQGGVNHVNEQWQDYWATHFAARDFLTVDCIRPRIWQQQDVSWWYRQNTLLYCKHDVLAEHPALSQAFEQSKNALLNVVHPAHYLQVKSRLDGNLPLRKLLRALPRSIRKELSMRLRRRVSHRNA